MMTKSDLVELDSANHTELLIEQFLIESGGSYNMGRFREWYRKKLYSEEGLRMLAKQKSQV